MIIENGIAMPDVRMVRVGKDLCQMKVEDAIGVALAYILLAAETHPHKMRAALSEKVIREGFTGVSMIETLKRVANG